jgi:hypothetical protein
MNTIYSLPSFYAHILNALFVLIATVYLFMNYSQIKPDQMIIILLLLSIAIGIHGLSHLGLEYIYGFNPLNNMKLEYLRTDKFV